MTSSAKRTTNRRVAQRLKSRTDISKTIAEYADAIESLSETSVVSERAIVMGRGVKHAVVTIDEIVGRHGFRQNSNYS